MKIRNGFVSNSSSSSFVVTTTLITIKEEFDDVVNSFQENEKTALKSFFGDLKKKKILGKERLVDLLTIYSPDISIDYDDEKEEIMLNLLKDFSKKINEKENSFFNLERKEIDF